MPTATRVDRAFDDYGFTNDAAHYERVKAFVAAAVADGWSIDPTYGSEGVDRAARLRREGYVLQVLTRDNLGRDKWPGKYRYEAKVHGWGPDGLALKMPDDYDWPTIQASAERCNRCGAAHIETFRYGFAGRACKACLPAAKAEYEKPGWCD